MTTRLNSSSSNSAPVYDFSTLLSQWDRRARLQQMSIWLPRALMPGLVLGIVLAVLSRIWVLFDDRQILTVTACAVLIGVVIAALVIMLWRRPQIVLARRFDVLFGLQERVSTALELMDGRITTDALLTAHQLDDAYEQARKVNPTAHLSLDPNWREWGIVGATACILMALLVLLPPTVITANDDLQNQVALEEAIEDVKEIIEDVAADNTLDAESREPLLEALQEKLETLQAEQITPEEAFATLQEIESMLQEQSEQLEELAQNQQEALSNAAQTLQPEDASVSTDEGEEGETGEGVETGATDLSEALADAAESLDDMTAEEQQALADALEQAAQQLAEAQPELAQQMQDAADALNSGNPQQAQQALQQAQQSAQQAQQAAQQAQQASQQYGQSAQQANQAAQSTVGQSGNNPSQNSANPSGNTQASPSDTQNGEGQGGSPMDADGDGQGGGQGQSGNSSNTSGGGTGDGSGSDSPSTNGSSGGTGGGAGDGEGGDGSNSGGFADDGGDNPLGDNNPDGAGVRDFAPIFAPNLLGGQNNANQDVQLSPDDSNMPLQEGEFQQNPIGNMTVPYNQVFREYAGAADRALNQDYIPLGLRDVIRDYFSSLDPNQ